ncbi:MAG: prolipoprotein diacylglyceryl transferase [Bacilli bacterium]|nr:prolipoprotein diacylglyceryl transferase [Bacilli bacterium]
MKKPAKLLGVILILLISIFAYGCQEQPQPSDTYKVSFVDYDGTVLKEVTCQTGVACEIVPPEEPDNKENAYFTRWSLFDSEIAEIDSDTTIEAIYTLDNRVVTMFGRSIVFYSFFIMLGIIIALTIGLREAKRNNVNPDHLIDGFLWIVPVAILGSRLWYVVFEWDQFVYGGFFPSVLRALGFSTGTLDFSSFGLAGLAIHGAFATAVICTIFYTKKKKLDLFLILDIVATGFIIAQASGRWGNFFNQEAHGYVVGGSTNGVMNLTLQEQYNYLRYTLNLPEFIVNNMYIKQGLHGIAVEPFTAFYHPTFFYESTINILGFFIMLGLRRIRQVHYGELLAFYLVWYGGLRIFIETMRTDPLTFELFGMTLKSAIVTSVFMIAGGILLSVMIRMKRKDMTYASAAGSIDINTLFGKKKDEEN